VYKRLARDTVDVRRALDALTRAAGLPEGEGYNLLALAVDAARAKASYQIWEYGSLPGVHFSAYGGDPDDARSAMAEAGASHAVVANLLDAPTRGVDPRQDLLAYNRWLCDLAARSPRFIPYLAVDANLMAVPDLVAHIRAMVLDHGAQGIKLHPPLQRLDLADRAFWPIFELCRELDIGIVSHSGPSRIGPQFGEPDAFRPVLAALPGCASGSPILAAPPGVRPPASPATSPTST
jgi:hypothetical protein